jgi:hypothetical protein
MFYFLAAFRDGDRARGADADASPTAAAGSFIQFRKKRATNPRPESDGFFWARVPARLARDAILGETRRADGDGRKKSARNFADEHRFGTGGGTLAAEGAFAAGEIQKR